MDKKAFFKARGISGDLTIKVTTTGPEGEKPTSQYIKLAELCDEYAEEANELKSTKEAAE